MVFSAATAVALFAAGLLTGAIFWHWRVGRANAEQAVHRIPKEWPLKLRPLVNSKERRVWLWLAKVMVEQQIMVKIPVTRFTAPANMQEAEHWFKLLNGLYCTFTVCNVSGQVIGCIDVPGRKGLSMGNQTLKHSLLSQCGIQYWIVDPDNLPHPSQIRSAFFNEEADQSTSALHEKLKDVAGNLQAAVSKKRSQKQAGATNGSADSSEAAGTTLTSHWENNSFLVPLDSRTAELRE